MSGLLQILPESVEGDLLRVRVRHILRNQHAEATVEIPRVSTPEDNEAIRWYLEEYLLYPFDPAPEIAARVEKRMEEIGADLFRHLFESNQHTSDIWLAIRTTIADTRIEIATGPAEGPIFWELLRNPLDSVPIACAAKAFLRVPDTTEGSVVALARPTSMRVLMVIARPGGSADVRFRSVATRVLNRLDGNPSFEFEVLRPPTFDALDRKLRAAHTRGQPYTIVHFDGHGIYEDLMAKHAGLPPKRKRGYLMFEDPDRQGIPDPIDGSRFAEMLVEHGVPVVLLNACRSARSEPSSTPSTEEEIGSARSFGSFAGELISAGAGAVVAMRYNIYVDTAAQFVAGIYRELALGEALPDAVTHARRTLLENPRRTSVSSPRDLRDWMVPVLFERHHVEFPPLLAAGRGNATDTSRLPPPPSSGFIGRDSALLELDRKFQSAGTVLMWGQVGSGKTTTAAEFTRWLAQTGGVDGYVLFTSFREYRTLPRVVDEAASAFVGELRARGVEWLTLDDSHRILLLLELLQGNRCFWIWDNVESISGGQDAWPPNEIAQFSEFLTEAAKTGTRILLTSRNRDVEWLADLASPLELPPMDLAERLELAVAISGPDIPFPQDVWAPLFHISEGNPFVLSLLVRQALMKGIGSSAAMTVFLDGVRSSSADLFGASIETVLRNEFNAAEQALLSLSCLFESNVTESVLDFLTEQKDPDKVEMNLNKGPCLCTPLLQRAARLGVLASIGAGYYTIHPGLPIHFRRIYSGTYTPQRQLLFDRGFVWIYASIARVFSKHYQSGTTHSSDVALQTLSLNETNLKRALTLARRQARWTDVVSILGGLVVLLRNSGRSGELDRVVNEIALDFVDPVSGAALPGQESFWITIQGYRVDLLTHAHRLSEAERLQTEVVRRGRELLRIPDKPATAPDESTRSAFANCVLRLATIQKDLGSKECLKTFEEALELAQRIGDTQMEGAVAYQIAGACLQPEFQDLDAAGYWLTYALDVTPKEDRIGRGSILTGLGGHAYSQFAANKCPPQELARWLAESIRFLEMALQVLPSGHIESRAACHANLGLAYFSAGGELTRAVNSFQQALSFQESVGEEHQAGVTRLNLARVFHAAGDRNRSLLFAGAALRSFASLAPDAEQDLVEAQDFIENLEGNREHE
jgi:tetratricopeptide (TPR) repeat protein